MSLHHTPAYLEIHGIRLLNLALEEAVCAIEGALEAEQPTKVAFVNADCVNIAARDAAYRRNLADIDWVFIDGIGMRIAGRLMRQTVRDNVNGTDLFPLLCASMAKSGKRVFLLGARPGIASAAANWAQSHYPGLVVAGTQHGYYDVEESPLVVKAIRDARPDVLLVALGAPYQEAWINALIATTGATVAIGVGGLFDYYSGRIPRAPQWMRASGLEWLFRLFQEPGRLWRRYLVGNFIFLARIGLDLLKIRPTQVRQLRRSA